MNSERWKQIEEVFQSALDLLSKSESDTSLKPAPAIRSCAKEVESLISDYQDAGSFIETPAIAGAFTANGQTPTTLPMDDEGDPMAGRRIGSYRIVREIGRGGMGAVYLALRADEEIS
ncbi:MAG: hypothetical protein WKF84_06025 [Pyrinomonadaceae bacterium]